jgi:hypothetical protein
MVAGVVNPGLSRRVLFLGICFLFGFVVFVPHKYLFSYEDSFVGLLANRLTYFPFVLSVLLFATMLLHHRGTRVVPQGIRLAVVVWLGLTVLSSIGSELPQQAMTRELYYAVTGVLLSVVAAVAFQESWSSGVTFLVFLSACLGLFCVYEFATGWHLWTGVFDSANARYLRFAPDGLGFGRRVLGTVGHPVYLGSYLVLVLPLGLWMIFQASGARIVLSVAATVLVSAGLLLTFSRGAWLGGAVGCLIYLRYRSSKQVWIVALAICLLLTLGFSTNRVWDTLKSRDTIDQLARFKTDQRGVAYAQSTSVLFGHPLLGVGTGLYRYAGSRAGDHDGTMDNMYLRLLSEHGVAGFAAIVVLFWGIYRVLRNAAAQSSIEQSDESADLCRAVIASLAGFLVDLGTCDALYFDMTRICFWIVVGLGLAVADQAKNEAVA